MSQSSSVEEFATTSVEFTHDYDLEPTLEFWSDTTRPGALPARPEKTYSREDVLAQLLVMTQSFFHPSQLSYSKLIEALYHPDEQLDSRSARELWTLLMSPERFTYGNFYVYNYRDKVTTRLDALDLSRPVSLDRCRTQVQELYKAFGKSQSKEEFTTQAPLIGLLGLLVGPDKALELWCDEIPDAHRGNLCDFLVRGTDEQEAAIAKLVASQPESTTWSAYRISALIRVPGPESLAYFLDTARDATLASTYRARDLMRQQEGVAAWIDYIEQVHSLDHQYYARSPDAGAWYGREEVLLDFIAADATDTLAAMIPALPGWLGSKTHEHFMERVLKIHHHGLVDAMLAIYDRPLIGKYARIWLINEGANAIFGLAQWFTKGMSKLRARALELLREYRDRGDLSLFSSAMGHMSDEVAAALQKHVLDHESASIQPVAEEDRPGWLHGLAADKKIGRKRLPEFLSAQGLPQVLTWYGASLSEEDTVLLCKALKESDLEAPHPAVAKFHEWLDEESAEELAWFIYQAWMRDRAKPSHKWALWSLAFLGSVHTPARLQVEMPKWSNNRAKWGAAVLSWLGSKEAVRSLLHFAKQRNKKAIWRHFSNGVRAFA